MWVSNGSIRQHYKWFELPGFSHKTLKEVPKSKEKVISRTEKLLRKAVYKQIVADVPVGAFLSGGLDSSSIIVFAREIVSDIQCFTIDINGLSNEGLSPDLPYAEQVAEHFNLPLNVLKIDSNKMAEELPGIVAQLDEPLADPASLNVRLICRLARKKGIKVLLSGAGGDDIFSGYRRHLALFSEKYWYWLPKKMRAFLEGYTSGLKQTSPFIRRLVKLFRGATLDGDEKLVNYFRWIERSDLMELYTPAFRNAIEQSLAKEPMLEFIKDLPSDMNRLERLLTLEQRFFLSDHNLTYTDKMSMAEGIEVRVPFLTWI